MTDKDRKVSEDPGAPPALRPIGFRAISAALSIKRPKPASSPSPEPDTAPLGPFLPPGFHAPPDD